MTHAKKKTWIRPESCIEVAHRLWTWAISHALDPNPQSANGPIMYAHEFIDLEVPLSAMLRRLAGGPDAADLPEREVKYWNRAVRRAAFAEGKKRPVHFSPGEPVPEGVLHHAELSPEPGCLPFSDIGAAQDRLAAAYRIPGEVMRFVYNGVHIGDADILVRLVRIRPGEVAAIVAALDRWRDNAIARLMDASLSEVDYAPDVPDWVRGKPLSRPFLAKFIGRTRKTLRIWDRTGEGPFDLPWVPGTKIGGNVVQYDVGTIWTTIDGIMTRAGRKRERWIEAMKRQIESYMAGENPVVDAVVAREKSARRSVPCPTN